jgi:hypothetical protein
MLQFTTNRKGLRKSEFNVPIPVNRFEESALEMINADPEATITAFAVATFKALHAAMHPPKPEPKPQPLGETTILLGGVTLRKVVVSPDLREGGGGSGYR